MHKFSNTTTGMHWLCNKDGGASLPEILPFEKQMPVRPVALGGSPSIILCSYSTAAPPDVDEMLFAGFLGSELLNGKSKNS
jgi:UbiD family decarboxylase